MQKVVTRALIRLTNRSIANMQIALVVIVNSAHLHYNKIQHACEAISGYFVVLAQNCLPPTLEYIVKQMKKTNHEKGHSCMIYRYVQGQGPCNINLCLFVVFAIFTGLSNHCPLLTIPFKGVSHKPRAFYLILGFLADVFDCYTWSFIMSGILVQVAALLPLVLFCLGKKKGFDLKNNITSDEQLATYRHYNIWSTQSKLINLKGSHCVKHIFKLVLTMV